MTSARSASAALAALICLGCAGVSQSPGTVEMYVTTGDRAKLLHREPDLSFIADGDSSLPTIVVDDTRAYQSVIGFGASLTDASAWLMQHRLAAEQRDSLLRELFGRDDGALGFSFVRVDMGASDFARTHYSYNDVRAGHRDSALAHFSIDPDRAETLPILKRAFAINPQLTLMATPWSAPAWMKTSGSMISGTLRDDAFAPFAEYFRKFVQAYAGEGIRVHLVSVQNEPHYEPKDYPGMRLEPAARARFIGQYLGPLFVRSGITAQILDWDHNWDQADSPLRVLGDSVARRYVAGVAWHCYGGDVAAQSVVHDAHPDKDTYFTECSGGAWAPNFGDNLLWTVRHLIIGSTRHWARGVLMWNLALDETHGPHLGGCGDCRGVVTIDSRTGAVTRNEEYYAFGHASRFVRPGARRIESSTSVAGLESVAFRDAENSRTSLIVLNPDTLTREFRVRADARAFQATLPARSIATFVWR